MRNIFIVSSILIATLLAVTIYLVPSMIWALVVVGPILLLGWVDVLQRQHTIRRNYPLAGRMRYLFEAIRPEINQYFIESNTDGRPYSREQRSLVYQRAKKALDTQPFGTQRDVFELGYEWLMHSMAPSKIESYDFRIPVGQGEGAYSLSLLNISAMSFGSLSKQATLALNGGAKDGGFAHNTGEGGISPYHQEPGGDLVWQIGTGYFGCRDEDGGFDELKFKDKATLDQVKMIELKLSQGAKPGHGGILPKQKVTQEISEIRGVPLGQDVISPPSHRGVNSPRDLATFVGRLQGLAAGKPVGIKLCLGVPTEFVSLVRAFIDADVYPDFIAVDGSEGGTGAAPLEFSNNIGYPSSDSIIMVDDILKGYGIRDKVKIIATGKVTGGFSIVKCLALGADAIYSARSMMMALGCIQALRCNANVCPAGVATQNPELSKGIIVADKRKRVFNYHHHTLDAVREILEAIGVQHPDQIKRYHIKRRVSRTENLDYEELFPEVASGSFLKGDIPKRYQKYVDRSNLDRFGS